MNWVAKCANVAFITLPICFCIVLLASCASRSAPSGESRRTEPLDAGADWESHAEVGSRGDWESLLASGERPHSITFLYTDFSSLLPLSQWNASGLSDVEIVGFVQCRGMTPSVADWILQFPRIQTIEYHFSFGITDDVVLPVVRADRIVDFCLEGAAITDATLKALAPAKTLRRLSLLACDAITPAGLRHLPPSITDLSLTWSDAATDEGCSNLVHLITLEWLSLRGTQVSDASLASLSDIKSLRTLLLYDCYNISDAALSNLQVLRPEITVYR